MRDDEDIPLHPHGKPPAMLGNRMPCRWCGDPTLVSMLNHYGARCLRCYEAYCQEPQATVDVGDKRKNGPRAWAHALKLREERGERLSIVQGEMWRAAINAHDVLDRAREGEDIPPMRIVAALQHTGDIPWPDRDVPAFDEPGLEPHQSRASAEAHERPAEDHRHA